MLEDRALSGRVAAMEEGEAGPSQPVAEGDDIARFVAVTNCPPEAAEFFLGAAGSFDRAVSLYYGMLVSPAMPPLNAVSRKPLLPSDDPSPAAKFSDTHFFLTVFILFAMSPPPPDSRDRAVLAEQAAPEQQRTSPVGNMPPRPRAPNRPGAPRVAAPSRGPLAAVVNLPGALIRSGLSLIAASCMVGGVVLNALGTRLLPGFIMRRVRGAHSRPLLLSSKLAAR